MPLNLQGIINLGLVGAGGSSGGGGGGYAAVSPKEVNFYDYDGTCVHAYTVAEAQALSELPAGPEHPGLVFQGWNWSLEGVKGLTRPMNVGAMYTTDDGTTRLYITLQEGRTSPMLGVDVNGTVTVDWGDGTEPDVLTNLGKNVMWTPNHKYEEPGEYVIRIAVDGSAWLAGGNSASYLLTNSKSSSDYTSSCYRAAIKKIEIGNGIVGIEQYSFSNLVNLATVSMADGVSIDGTSAFYDTYGLKYITLPPSSSQAGNSTFTYAYGIKNVSFPENATIVYEGMFSGAKQLTTITIPDGVTRIKTNAFKACPLLTLIVLPKNLVSIDSSAFSSCYGMRAYDFTSCTVVPSLKNTGAFTSIPADCEIRVPAALYDEWIAATNWATYASYIKAY